MKPYRLSEDVFAILLGGAILLLAALAFIWLPYQEVAEQYTLVAGTTDFSPGDWPPVNLIGVMAFAVAVYWTTPGGSGG